MASQAQDQLAKRFPHLATPNTRTPGTWTMEDLLDKPGAQGACHAAARAGDLSARQALKDLHTAVTAMPATLAAENGDN